MGNDDRPRRDLNIKRCTTAGFEHQKMHLCGIWTSANFNRTSSDALQQDLKAGLIFTYRNQANDSKQVPVTNSQGHVSSHREKRYCPSLCKIHRRQVLRDAMDGLFARSIQTLRNRHHSFRKNLFARSSASLPDSSWGASFFFQESLRKNLGWAEARMYKRHHSLRKNLFARSSASLPDSSRGASFSLQGSLRKNLIARLFARSIILFTRIS